MHFRKIINRMVIVLGVIVWYARAILILFCILFFSGMAALWFETDLPVVRGWESELTEPPQVAEVESKDCMYYNGETFSVDPDQTAGWAYILCQYEDQIFYVVAEKTETENVYVWSLFSEKVGNKEKKNIYSNRFYHESYVDWFSDVTVDLYAKSPVLSSGGMYYDGKIYLFDDSRVAEFDIESETILETPRDQYIFPQTDIWVELSEYADVILYGQRDGEEKSISLFTLAEKNDYAKELQSVGQDWNSFSVCEDVMYISILVTNPKGHTYALVFEYKLEETVKFVSKRVCASEVAVDHHLIPVVYTDRVR